MQYPDFYEVKQSFPRQKVKDVRAKVIELFEGFDFASRTKPGQSVAVGVGSRGTHDLKDLVATSVECLKERGLKPFIIPAMGSHGGATGPGQASLLKDLGIDEQSTGCEVRATMDVTSLGTVETGAEVFIANDALSADRIMVINRVKPHTLFRSRVESGLCKMLAVGLGRQVGASNMHKYDLAKTIIPSAELIMKKAPVLCGLSVTENAYGDTHSMELSAPEDIVESDARMLEKAWTIFPRLPMKQLDFLIVDRMGKDVSGAGMDPNVIGFWRRQGGPRDPDFNRLAVLDLTEASHGNAMGMGMADLTTRALASQLDIKAIYTNAITSTVFAAARIPLTLENDREIMDTILNLTPDLDRFKAGRITDTGSLRTFWVTKAVLADLEANPNVEASPEPLPVKFDQDGKLRPFGVAY